MKSLHAFAALPAMAGALFLSSCAVPAKVDPAAHDVLYKCTEKLRNASTLQVFGTRDADPALLAKSLKSEHASFEMAVSRPGDMAIRGRDAEGVHHLLAGNGGITLYNEKDNVYSTIKAESTNIDGLVEEVEDKYDVKFTIGEMLGEDPYGTLMDGVTEVKMGGDESVNGTACTRLDFKQKDLLWSLWIAKSDSLPRKSVLIYIEHPAHPKRTVTVDHWVLDKPIPHSMFSLSMRKGAHEVQVIH
jgi:hypothetical protein